MIKYQTMVYPTEPSDRLSAIRFWFENDLNIYYYPDENEWFGVNEDYEPVNPTKVRITVKNHNLVKEVQGILLDHAAIDLKDSSDGWRYMTKVINNFKDYTY